MKIWTSLLLICFLVAGCASTSNKSADPGKGLLIMSTDTSYIVAGTQIDKDNGEALMSALDNTGHKKLIVIEKDIEHLLTLREQFKTKGYSLFYIDSERRVKAVSL